MNVQPMYLGESAPKELRGAVAMTSAIFTAVGLVMGQVVGLRYTPPPTPRTHTHPTVARRRSQKKLQLAQVGTIRRTLPVRKCVLQP